MALDGIFLSKIVPELRKSFPLRIQKIWDISNTEMLFQVHGSNGKEQLLISTHSLYNRILFSKQNYPTPKEPSNFTMLLRKYLEGSYMEDIEQYELDRWLTINIKRRNNIGDIEHLKLYVELMGKYANIILVNEDNKIIDALKRIPPLENNRRTIHPGALFSPTDPQEKKNPFINQEIDKEKSLTAQFSGFSPFLSKEIEYRLANGETFKSIIDEIKESKECYIANSNNEAQFHCIELKHLGVNKSYPLFEGLDILYFHKEEKERIKQIAGDLYHVANRNLKHYKQKLPRLLNEYDEAKDCGKYKKYGDLLYTYNVDDTKGENSITLLDYETEKDIIIPLDPKYDGKSNARKHFQKYNKLKKGQIYIQEQIQICEKEIDYFEGILEQLDQADFNTALEIKDELIQGEYIKDNKKKNKNKNNKKNNKIKTYTIDYKGTLISFGKNNIQNDNLTWTVAKRNEIWLHAKDYHGSHVVIHKDNPNEEELRLAANIAAYYSQGRYSSSVPVIHCKVKDLKKIPGSKPGTVQLTNYQTIYIDPDEELVLSLNEVD